MPVLSTMASVALAAALQSPGSCTAPVFPARSTTADGLRRVQSQWKAWESCSAAQNLSAEQRAPVQQAAEAWLKETLAYAEGARHSAAVAGQLAADARRFELALREQCGRGQPAGVNGCR